MSAQFFKAFGSAVWVCMVCPPVVSLAPGQGFQRTDTQIKIRCIHVQIDCEPRNLFKKKKTMELLCQTPSSLWFPWYFLIPWDHLSVSDHKFHSVMHFMTWPTLANQREDKESEKAAGDGLRLWKWQCRWMQRWVPLPCSFGSCRRMLSLPLDHWGLEHKREERGGKKGGRGEGREKEEAKKKEEGKTRIFPCLRF